MGLACVLTFASMRVSHRAESRGTSSRRRGEEEEEADRGGRHKGHRVGQGALEGGLGRSAEGIFSSLSRGSPWRRAASHKDTDRAHSTSVAMSAARTQESSREQRRGERGQRGGGGREKLGGEKRMVMMMVMMHVRSVEMMIDD
ncbi:unnamed protein product [Lampetra planeri]